mgnify:CR=1 FL=1
MSVWDAIVGQQAVVEQLKAIAAGDPKAIAQSWLICGPPGSGRSNVARAFAAALDTPDHGLADEPDKARQQILAGTHPDVTVLATNKVTISIDEVRELIGISEQMPSTAPWRVIIIEDVDRMLERTTNVLLKEIDRLKNGGKKADVEPETKKIVEQLTGIKFEKCWPQTAE